MNWFRPLLGLLLFVCGCAQPYASNKYAAPATGRSRLGLAADAQPRDVQSALQKYIEAN